MLMPAVYLLSKLFGPFPEAAAKGRAQTDKPWQRVLETARFEMPVLGITGKQDGCISRDGFELHHTGAEGDYSFPWGHHLLLLDNAGHFSMIEAPKLVADGLIHFFREEESMRDE